MSGAIRKLRKLLRRRRSSEDPPDLPFQPRRDCSRQYASTFVKQFGESESRMKDIVNLLQYIDTEFQKSQKTARETAIAGGVVAVAAGAIAVIAAPFAALGLVIAGIVAGAGAAAGGGAAVGGAVHLSLKEKRFVEELEKITCEFRMHVEQLNKTLENLKHECEIHNKRSDISFNISQLLRYTQNLISSINENNISPVAEQYTKAFGELVKMKTNLQSSLYFL